MKIELYLDGHSVDISQDIDFVLNKQLTELTDLTSIIVDYTKTIRIPMTPRNNELFNYVFKLDHQVLVGQQIINYDPSNKIPMSMTYNGSQVMEGYALLSKIDLNDQMYEVNLYGELGKIFSALKEKNLLNYSEFGSTGFWEEVVMNTYTIDQSFANDTHSLDWSSTNWYDFFGWAPQLMGKTDDIDTKSYEEHSTGDVKNFADLINTTRNIDYADIYVGDGLDINSYNEVRTYMCRPYVYCDKLVKLVQQEINQNSGEYDGYTMELEGDWFSQDNPYWYRMVYFPGTDSMVDNGDSIEGYVTWNSSAMSYSTSSWLPVVSSSSIDGYTYTTSGNVITITGPAATITISGDNIQYVTTVTNCNNDNAFGVNGKWAYYCESGGNLYAIYIPHIDILDDQGRLMCKMYLCDDTIVSVKQDGWNRQNITSTGMWDKLKRSNSKVFVPNSCNSYNQKDGTTNRLVQNFNIGRIPLNGTSFQFAFNCDKVGLTSGVIMEENVGFTQDRFLHPFKDGNWGSHSWNSNSVFSSTFTPPKELDITSNTYRSMSRVTVRDILGNDFNPFKWLINYVKKFRLVFDIDYSTKTITLKDNYFGSVTYKEVIVDYDKPVVIEPIVDKYNKVKFDYKDNESKKGVQYLTNYGVDYGDMVFMTGINVNNETLILNPDTEEGVFIPTKVDTLSWATLNSTNPLKSSNTLNTNKVINTLNKKNEVQYFPFYAFRWPNATSPSHGQPPFYRLTDDSPTMRSTGKYTYLQSTGWDTEVETTTEGGVDVYYSKSMAYIPQFDNYYSIRNGSSAILYWVTFGVPVEVYNDNLSQNNTQVSIYDRWSRYLNEIFNVNNKKVTCYIRMSYPEFINFKFNQLFVIDQNVFLVNKIVDFNPNSTEPTKVELIQISDVASLT